MQARFKYFNIFKKSTQQALFIASIYSLFGAAWVLLSDRLFLILIKDITLYSKIQHVKGVLFVFVTASVLFIFLKRYFNKLEIYEKQIIKERDFFRITLDSVPVGIVLAKIDGTIQNVNKEFEKIVEKKTEEVIGKNFWDVIFLSNQKQGHNSEHSDLMTIKNQESFHYELDLKDNSLLIIGETKQIHGNQILVIIMEDITALKKKERMLIDSEQQLREIVDNAYSVILRISLDGKILFINNYGELLFGYDAHEIVGKSALGTIIPEIESTGRDLKVFFSDLLNNPRKYTCNINENTNKYGNRFWVFWVNTLLTDSEGNPKEILSIGTDITELKKLQQELENYKNNLELLVHERTKQLEEANEKLKELDKLKSMFIASMSHELRTPLNSIIGFSSILLNEWVGPLNDEQKKNIETINKAGKHLLSLVNDIIDISKIESGLLDIKIEETNTETIIEECINLLIQDINKKGLNLIKNIKPENILTDKKRLKQVIFNLINNAIKFTDTGYIKINSFTTNEDIIIEVEDSGIGIKDEDKDKLFKPFQRVSPQKLSYIPGTGLGLYISKKIVEDVLNGSISLESQYEKGSKFTIKIPKKLTYEKGVSN